MMWEDDPAEAAPPGPSWAAVHWRCLLRLHPWGQWSDIGTITMPTHVHLYQERQCAACGRRDIRRVITVDALFELCD